MKRYFITLMVTLILCLGFSSQVEAKTNVIDLCNIGNKPPKLKLGDNKIIYNKVITNSKASGDMYFDVTKKGYYTFTLSNFVITNGYKKYQTYPTVGFNISWNTPMDNGEPYLDFVTELNRGGFTSDSKTVYFAKTSTIRFINGTYTGSVHLNIKYSKTKPAGKVIKPLSKYLKYNIVSGGFDSGIVYGNPYPVLGRNYYLFEQDTKFVVPYTGKYR